MKRLQKNFRTESGQEWTFSSFEGGSLLVSSSTSQPMVNDDRNTVSISLHFNERDFEHLLHFLQSNFFECTKED